MRITHPFTFEVQNAGVTDQTLPDIFPIVSEYSSILSRIVANAEAEVARRREAEKARVSQLAEEVPSVELQPRRRVQYGLD